MYGVVLRGSRNIFTVRPDGDSMALECRIKGKVLKDAEGFYNPLAPGDRVKVETDPSSPPQTGMIVSLEKRRNLFSRYNQKGAPSKDGTQSRDGVPSKDGAIQLLAANVDMVLWMTSRFSPPFRPRFLDRVLLQADSAGIPVIIVCNKVDLDDDDYCEDILDINERLEDFKRLGYEIIEISAKTGKGLDELRGIIGGKCSVLTGQSGVGKSSLINALFPELKIKTAAINEKYNRGNHTTTLAFMVEAGSANEFAAGTRIIDTPGVRRFVPSGIDAEDLILNMREFAPLAGKCSYGLSCSHRIEPGCKIMEAVDAGVIHEDRYNSFLRIHDELSGKNNAD
jgi:ribosome biogenesis GTPase